MVHRNLRVLAVVGLGAMAACGDGASIPSSASTDDVAPQAFGELVSVEQISVYQAVKVSLVSEGAPVAPNAPVIAKRRALVRLHAKAPLGTKVPKLTAELRVRNPGQPDMVLQSGPRNLGAFQEGDLSSSFYWELEAEQVTQGAQLSVEIRDPSGADPSIIRYPSTGELSMNVGAFEPTLKVKFVPIKYQADGSDRVPTMDSLTIEGYRQALYKMYPVTAVDISVRDVVAWPLEVRGDGEGWSDLLAAVMETREDDNVADDVYYVGVFTPAATQREYCERGCILGVAPAVGLAENVSLRAAMIVGYHSESSHGTLAQELAHAMGRMHAPCGNPAAIDRKYPYDDANIGAWGWDLAKRELVDPDDVYDFMSYCSPVWVSDYTYAGIYDRMVKVDREKRPEVSEPPSQAMKTYHVAKDGTLRPGRTVRGGFASSSEEVVLENGAHQAVGTVRGSFHALSNLGGGILVTPKEIPAATLKRARFARVVAQ